MNLEAHLEPELWRTLVKRAFFSNEISGNISEIRTSPSFFLREQRWNRVLERYTDSGKQIRYLAGAILAIKGYTMREIEQRTGLATTEVTDLTARLENLYAPLAEEEREKDSDLLRQLRELRKDQVSVMMGTTPSGPLHLANVYTLATGAYRVDQACKKVGVEPHFALGLNDLLVTEEQAQHVPEHRARIQRFLDTIRKEKRINITLQNYSDVQREPGFREQLREYKRLRLIPLTVSVERSIHGEHHFSPIDLRNEQFDDPDRDYRITELQPLIALRARYAKVDVYILGGDHTHARGTFSDAIYLPGVSKPRLISTGVLYGLDGKEMHVSQRNFIPLENLEKQKGWLDKVLKLADAPTRHLGPLDYMDLLPDTGVTMYGVAIA